MNGLGEQSSCSYVLIGYTIVLSPELESTEQKCMMIGHEMYHRVTMHRKGLRSQVWVDELLAFLTALWFLNQHGFSDYADAIVEYYKDLPVKINLRKLCEFRRPSWYISLKTLEPKYPENFYTEVGRLAIALKRIVSKNDFCKIIKVNTLEEWIAALPNDKQYSVSRLLEVSCDDKKVPEEGADLAQLFHALAIKGDDEALISEFQDITHLYPSNGAAAYYLGRAYQRVSQFDAARDAYLKAIELNFPEKWLPFNLATCYWYRKDFSSAAQWYQEATNRDPQWASAIYNCGRSLIKMGNLLSARAAWEKVLTLDNKYHKRLAQKALQYYPIRDTS